MMKTALALAISLLLAACQIYAGTGTIVSDGQTTTVRTSEVEAGTETGPSARTSLTVIARP